MGDYINPQVLPPVSAAVEKRANEVRRKLKALRNGVEDNVLDMAELLLEAQQKQYHAIWGYTKFGDWVVEASDLDMSEREAYYLLNIVKKGAELELTREQLRAAKITKLKEIFVLKPEKHADEMRALVAAAGEGETLENIKEAVRQIKNAAGIREKFMTIKVEAEAIDTVDQAFELARMNYGDTIRAEGGEVGDISNSKVVELICVEYLNDPNNYPEGVTREDL